jgi:hypothetical protein
VCDNYVINIGADGRCECYVETARADNFRISEIKEIAIYKPGSKEPLLTLKEPQRGQRAKCNIYDDACDVSFLKEDLEKIQQTLEQDSIPCTMKVAELNKPNKNKSTIREVMPECDLPICDWSCTHALRSGPTFNPELWCDKMKGKPAVGLFCSEYEEEK